MRTCPQCDTKLTDQALLAGLCPACGASLKGIAGQQEPAGGPSNRDTDADIMATMQFGSGEAGAEPSPQENDATADLGDSPLPPRKTDAETIKQTIDGDHPAEDKPISDAADVGATVDVPVGRDTDHDAVLKTIDLDQAGPLRPDPDPADTMATMDVADAALPKKPGRDTDHDAVLRTLDVGEVDKGPQGTVNPPGDDDDSYSKPQAGVTAADSDRIREVWAGKIPIGSRTGATLKVDSTTTLGTGAVIIKSRSVAKSHDTPEAQAADYEILKEIGQGGMGVVYSARQANFNREVAIKMLRPGIKGKNKRNEFVSEAVTTGDLDHPNIVPVYDLGTNEEGALFYAMKCVQGTPWDKALPKQSLVENVETLLRTADAIAFAHANGVVHRDLKPENIMLGSFGEVLVMDWGLAVRFAVESDGRIRSSGTSMGGTPAYMAPELVLGPMERIGPAADIYLLGAMLHEIVTAKPPHTGTTPLECLYAAADNVIVPTDASGELLDIAMKAMRTEPKDRYKSVTAFQKAIRDYQSHSESIALLDNARKQLATATQSGDYQDYSRALFGCQEAISLWEGNTPAREEIGHIQLAYATTAKGREDFDLAESLLDTESPDHADLLAEVRFAKREREAKVRRLRTVKRVAVVAVATVLVVVTTAYFEIRKQRDLAEGARQRAVAAQNLETLARKSAVAAKEEAVLRRKEAEEAKATAVAAENVAERKRVEAEEARQTAEIAKRAEQYEAYVAQIGLAAAKVDDNAFSEAERLLADCRQSEFRRWEWSRLWHLCRQSIQNIAAEGPIEAVAFGPGGHRILLGSWDGKARIVDTASDAAPVVIAHGGFVHAVAFSHNGRVVATGANDRVVRLWDAETGRPVAAFAGHEDAVVSVAFSADDRWLLTSSHDGTARLWDIESRKPLAVLQGHSWWVWQAAFSADATRIVTAGQDGRAIVWAVAETGLGVECHAITEFSGHDGPVRTACFSADGAEVVSGDDDGRVLVWRPAEVRPVDLDARIEDLPEEAPPYRELTAHDASVSNVTYSGDGRLIATAGHDNVVKLSDAASGKLIKTLRGHGGRVQSCDFSPDDTLLLSGSHDGQAKIWSLDGYREIRVLKGRLLDEHTDIVLSARFAPDGKHIVTASRDRTARTWDAATGRLVSTLSEGHEFLASSAVFFADGRRVLTGAGDNTVRIWDVAVGTELLRLEGTGRTGAVAVSHNEAWILTGSASGAAQIFCVSDGKLLQTLAIEGQPPKQPAITAVAFSADDSLLLVGNAQGGCRVWSRNADSGQWTERFQWRNHSRRITAAAFLPDGSRVLTASLDNSVAQWDLQSGEELTTHILRHPKGVTSMALLPQSDRAVTTCDDGRLRLWDLETAATLAEMSGDEDALHHVAVSPDGTRALTTNSQIRTVRLWDLDTHAEVFHPDHKGQAMLDFARLGGQVWTAVFTPDGNRILSIGGNDARIFELGADEELMSFSPHGAVAAANYSPDGRLIVTASWDNSAKIWDAASGSPIRKLVGGHDRYVNSAVFAPGGKTVLTAGEDGRVRFWNVDSGELSPDALTGHTAGIRRVVLSTDGRLALTASDDHTARVWDVASKRTLQTLSGHDWAVLDAAFSADATLVVTGSEDNRANVYDVAGGKLLRTLEGHTAAVTCVAFSPDGSRVLTGSRDHAVKLWDARSGKEILTLRGHTQEVTSVAFSPNGKTALSSSRDGTAVLWLASGEE